MILQPSWEYRTVMLAMIEAFYSISAPSGASDFPLLALPSPLGLARQCLSARAKLCPSALCGLLG